MPDRSSVITHSLPVGIHIIMVLILQCIPYKNQFVQIRLYNYFDMEVDIYFTENYYQPIINALHIRHSKDKQNGVSQRPHQNQD